MDTRVWEEFRQKYGDRWNYFMPPQGTPYSFIQNSTAINTAVSKLEAEAVLFQTTSVMAQPGEVLVITRYACHATAAVVNPYWPGYLPTFLPPNAFQGRFAWTVMTVAANANDKSFISNVTYQNTDQFPAGTIQNGKSLFQEYSTGAGAPPFIVEPGSTAYIAVYALPDNRGAEPPPPDSPPIVLTAELVGYRLPVPNPAAMGPHPQPQGPRQSIEDIPGRRVWQGAGSGPLGGGRR